MIKYLEDFKKTITMYDIEIQDVCFVTSVVLATNNVRENNDLEFVLKSHARRNLEQFCNTIKYNPYSGFIRLNECMSCVVNPYKMFGISDDMLFLDEYSKKIEGFRVINLELYIAKKFFQNRKKDEGDLQLVKETPLWDLQFEEKFQKYIKLAIGNGYEYPVKNREELWTEIMKTDFYIFGTGYAGKNIYRRIKKEENIERLRGFVVSEKQTNDVLWDMPVYELNKISDKKIRLLVAVEFCNMLEVIHILRQKGFSNLVAAYMFWE